MCDKCEEIFFYNKDLLLHQTICVAIKEEPEDIEDDYPGKTVDKAGPKEDSYQPNDEPTKSNNAARDNITEIDPNVPGHVTLEALQNTKVAVAQFAASALANSPDKESTLQELAQLQSSLFSLQHQQIFQLQLIQQLQDQLSEPTMTSEQKKKLIVGIQDSQNKLLDMKKVKTEDLEEEPKSHSKSVPLK